MKSIHPPLFAVLVLGCTTALYSHTGLAATSVPSERNRAIAKALPLQWRSETFPAN